MKVVILCGGQGTRLGEHTEHLPKPLVRVGDRPIVWHIMKQYAAHGFTDFVLCLGYKGDRIKQWFHDFDMYAQDFTVRLGQPPERRVTFHGGCDEADWTVTLVDTGDRAMTGARVKRVAKYLDQEPFLLTYGDGVADVDLTALVAFHQASGATATVTGVRPPARFGELLLEGDQVRAFSEKPQVRDSYINGGFFVCEPEVLDYLSAEDGCIFERAPLETLAAEGQLAAYRHDGFWQCMDTPRDWKFLNETWDAGQAPWATWQHGPAPLSDADPTVAADPLPIPVPAPV